MSRRLLPLACVVLAAACSRAGDVPATSPMTDIAERYVKLVLAMGVHDAAYVDAYYGPPEWKQEADQQKRPLSTLDSDAAALIDRLLAIELPGDELERLRHEYLTRQLQALRARIRMLSGAKLGFDEESQALYDAVAPKLPETSFQQTRDEIEKLVPGRGPLIDRVEGYRKQFVIARERLPKVFDLAIAECRRRTLPHVQLPGEESFAVEYVTGQSWSAYNWYQGNFRSLIQVNTDLPIFIDRAVHLACHEGYPGHHVYNALLEKHLTRDRGWVEFSIYALFSPQSLIAEGTADYGIDVAFPGEERLAFERDLLFPAAGLDPARVGEYYRLYALLQRLTYAGNEAARRYLNGELDRAAAAQFLTRFELMAPERAEQRTRFFDDYRSYVINYTLGEDLVKQFIEARAGGDTQKRWTEFVRLLGSPRLPSGLR
jgi:hypothetical protein